VRGGFRAAGFRGGFRAAAFARLAFAAVTVVILGR
jgi:hypothetical protein